MTLRSLRATLASLLFILWSCGDSTDSTNPTGGCGDQIPDDAAEVIALYGAAWGESDPAARLCLLEQSFAADGIYVDPTAYVDGRQALVDHIGAFRGPSPTGGIENSGAPELRPSEGRFGWVLKDASGNALLGGEDWIEFAEDGRLARVHGFFGTATNAPAPAAVLAWQEAWNAGTTAERLAALEVAVTDDVRFTDGIADVTGRAALADEMARQQEAFGGFEVSVGDPIHSYVAASGETLIRLSVEISSPGGTLLFTDYARMREHRTERIAGFPGDSLARGAME